MLSKSHLRLIALLLLGFVVSLPADAKRRSTRVDAGAWGDEKNFGTVDCPGTVPLSGNAAASLPVDWGAYRFHGIGDTAYTHNMYCQATVSPFFDASAFEFLDPPEPALATLVGSNIDSSITGIRYTWMTGDFLFDGPSFQWTFFQFPNGITIVALYGFIDPGDGTLVTLDASTAIKQGADVLWDSANNSFDGEYFCFVDGAFAGLWNGELNDAGSACLDAGDIFSGAFE